MHLAALRLFEGILDGGDCLARAVDTAVICFIKPMPSPGHFLELAQDCLGRGLDGLLPVVEMVVEAEAVAAETAIDNAAGLIFNRRDVRRADVAGLVDPDRGDAGARR